MKDYSKMTTICNKAIKTMNKNKDDIFFHFSRKIRKSMDLLSKYILYLGLGLDLEVNYLKEKYIKIWQYDSEPLAIIVIF